MAGKSLITGNYVVPYNIGPISGLGGKFARLADEIDTNGSVTVVSQGCAVRIDGGRYSLVRDDVVAGLPVADLPSEYFFS